MGAGHVCRRRRRRTAVPDAIVAYVQLPPRSFTPGGLGAPRDCYVVATLAGEQTVLRQGLRRHPWQPPATPATNTVSRLQARVHAIVAAAEATVGRLWLYLYWHSSCSHRARIALNLKGVDYEYKAVNLLKGDPGALVRWCA